MFAVRQWIQRTVVGQLQTVFSNVEGEHGWLRGDEDLVLRNLVVAESQLAAISVALDGVAISAILIKELHASFPWGHLFTHPVKVRIVGVEVVLRTASSSGRSGGTPPPQSGRSAPPDLSSWLNDWTRPILTNLSITIDNLVIKLNTPLAVGTLALRLLSVHNESGIAASHDGRQVVHKVCTVRDLTLTLEPSAERRLRRPLERMRRAAQKMAAAAGVGSEGTFPPKAEQFHLPAFSPPILPRTNATAHLSICINVSGKAATALMSVERREAQQRDRMRDAAMLMMGVDDSDDTSANLYGPEWSARLRTEWSEVQVEEELRNRRRLAPPPLASWFDDPLAELASEGASSGSSDDATSFGGGTQEEHDAAPAVELLTIDVDVDSIRLGFTEEQLDLITLLLTRSNNYKVPASSDSTGALGQCAMCMAEARQPPASQEDHDHPTFDRRPALLTFARELSGISSLSVVPMSISATLDVHEISLRVVRMQRQVPTYPPPSSEQQQKRCSPLSVKQNVIRVPVPREVDASGFIEVNNEGHIASPPPWLRHRLPVEPTVVVARLVEEEGEEEAGGESVAWSWTEEPRLRLRVTSVQCSGCVVALGDAATDVAIDLGICIGTLSAGPGESQASEDTPLWLHVGARTAVDDDNGSELFEAPPVRAHQIDAIRCRIAWHDLPHFVRTPHRPSPPPRGSWLFDNEKRTAALLGSCSTSIWPWAMLPPDAPRAPDSPRRPRSTILVIDCAVGEVQLDDVVTLGVMAVDVGLLAALESAAGPGGGSADSSAAAAEAVTETELSPSMHARVSVKKLTLSAHGNAARVSAEDLLIAMTKRSGGDFLSAAGEGAGAGVGGCNAKTLEGGLRVGALRASSAGDEIASLRTLKLEFLLGADAEAARIAAQCNASCSVASLRAAASASATRAFVSALLLPRQLKLEAVSDGKSESIAACAAIEIDLAATTVALDAQTELFVVERAIASSTRWNARVDVTSTRAAARLAPNGLHLSERRVIAELCDRGGVTIELAHIEPLLLAALLGLQLRPDSVLPLALPRVTLTAGLAPIHIAMPHAEAAQHVLDGVLAALAESVEGSVSATATATATSAGDGRVSILEAVSQTVAQLLRDEAELSVVAKVGGPAFRSSSTSALGDGGCGVSVPPTLLSDEIDACLQRLPQSLRGPARQTLEARIRAVLREETELLARREYESEESEVEARFGRR